MRSTILDKKGRRTSQVCMDPCEILRVYLAIFYPKPKGMGVPCGLYLHFRGLSSPVAVKQSPSDSRGRTRLEDLKIMHLTLQPSTSADTTSQVYLHTTHDVSLCYYFCDGKLEMLAFSPPMSLSTFSSNSPTCAFSLL